MREARAIERRNNEEHYWDFEGMINEARDVLDRGNRVRAREVWVQASAMFPAMAMMSTKALDFLLRLQAYDEADALVAKARKQYPHRAHSLEGLAKVALKRGYHEEAVRRCETLRSKHPASLSGYWIAAASLSELGRAAEAEAILARGMRIAPQDVGLRLEFARLAERRKDWTVALGRWIEVHEVCRHIAGVVGSAKALKELGRHDEADGLLSDAMYKAGNDPTVWLEHARIPEHKQDWEEAARRWEKLRSRFPMLPLVYIHSVRSLLELGHQADAEKVLREGISRLPDDPTPLIELAWLAHRRGDWSEAAARWTVVRERFPTRHEGYERGSEAMMALGRTEEAMQLRAMTAIKA